MTTPGFVEHWPHPFRELDDDMQPTGAAVEVFQLRPDLVDEFVAWSGGKLLLLNGGSVVLLPGHALASRRLVGLGDFGVFDGPDGDDFHAEPAEGFYQRFQPDGVDA